jgi:hypothetical protein
LKSFHDHSLDELYPRLRVGERVQQGARLGLLSSVLNC